MDNLYKYCNKFMYFILCKDENDSASLLYCSGISMSQFLPITRGRHGLASNPSMRGLQITDLNLQKELNERGASTAKVKGNPCDPHVPKGGDWYRQLLQIRCADLQMINELVSQCPHNLVQSIFKACMITDIALPSSASPEELEKLLTTICEEYSKQSGWPTTASAKGFRK